MLNFSMTGHKVVEESSLARVSQRPVGSGTEQIFAEGTATVDSTGSTKHWVVSTFYTSALTLIQ